MYVYVCMYVCMYTMYVYILYILYVCTILYVYILILYVSTYTHVYINIYITGAADEADGCTEQAPERLRAGKFMYTSGLGLVCAYI
jgi:hypothetical protein